MANTQKNNGRGPLQKGRYCWFCVNNVNEVNYKDTDTLRRYISSYGKIVATKRSGVCKRHQRHLARSIKQARFMALLPYIVD